ncbi:MAG: Eco57I restriction-modification methylase domain-containing protein [Gudongella sp.]|nr:Eco57I restriction-modification methylase domain-containing protein [Gudongella sp.]
MNGSDLTDYVEKGVSQPDVDQEVRIIDMTSYPVKDVLDILLQDKTTGKNIIWATDAYKIFGFGDKSCISPNHFKVDRYLLQPRINKSAEEQQERTRKKAEVFTPVWLCNKMNNYCDEQWFGRADVFNHENDDNTWTVIEDRVQFPEGKDWKEYVDSRRLEITCGEAPYLVSRYDASTGQFILPPLRRIGILDRKLRIVNENTSTEEDWIDWSIRALQSCYGYEWQGDSLLIARINFLMTFYDYYQERWSKDPEMDVLKQVANIIAWNLWQMDGLKDSVPFGRPAGTKQQMTFDSFFGGETKSSAGPAQVCKINNWRSKESLQFRNCKGRGKMSKKMFDFVIGNPPYQQEFTDEGNKTFAAPVYHEFMEEAFKVGDAVELIHPARFLFNAGSTPKAWNEKMLNDPHFKVLHYEEDASQVFNGVDIKGGVAISYYSSFSSFAPIVVYTKYPELNDILQKTAAPKNDNFSYLVNNQNKFNLDILFAAHPEVEPSIGSDGRDKRFRNNIFDKLPTIFTDEPTYDSDCSVVGVVKNKRVWKYIDLNYVDQEHPNLNFWKVLISSAIGNGSFGESIGKTMILQPGQAYTQTYLGIGSCSSKEEAENIEKYLKTKFCRALIGVLKTTQHITPDTFRFVNNQDFSSHSDIDWSKSIPDIDDQLFLKYDLSDADVNFIKKHVQEMN